MAQVHKDKNTNVIWKVLQHAYCLAPHSVSSGRSGKNEVPGVSPSEFRKKPRAEHEGTTPRRCHFSPFGGCSFQLHYYLQKHYHRIIPMGFVWLERGSESSIKGKGNNSPGGGVQ